MSDYSLLPDGINDERSRAIIDLLDRLDEADRTVLLTYRIASVPATALFALAWQFDVLGYAGWDLAHSDAERRALISRAIELHKYKGTVWSIQHALEAVGYGEAVVEEGIAAGLDHWAKFRVRVRLLADDVELSAAERELIGGIIRVYKNARSTLDSLVYTTPEVTDDVAAADDPPMDVIVTALLFHDGTFFHDGAITHRGALPGSPITVP
jgi:phage tail P2-like protein